jgi:hypothetical protein
MKILRVALAMLLGLALALPGMAQQEPPAPKPDENPKPAKRAKKVWTEDDLPSIRKPMDEYLDKQAAEAAAAKAASETAATEAAAQPSGKKQPGPEEAPTGVFFPTSLEQVEKWLAFKVEEVYFQEQTVSELRNQYFAASGEERQKLAAKLEEQTKILEQGREELKELRAHRERMQSKPPAKDAAPKPPQQ